MIKNIVIICGVIFSLIAADSDSTFFSGTWCIGNENLVINFTQGDSIKISSKRDETVGGSGVYNYTDSTFTADILNDELSVKMVYRYKKESDKKVKAKIVLFTVDGDSVDHPKRWLRMEKCNPETFKFEGDDKENED